MTVIHPVASAEDVASIRAPFAPGGPFEIDPARARIERTVPIGALISRSDRALGGCQRLRSRWIHRP